MREDTNDSDGAVATLARTDRDAFGILIQRYEHKLDRYLRRLGIGDTDDRRDLLQDVFVSVYRNLNDYDESLSFSSWIYRIAHNTAMSFHRHYARHPFGPLIDDAEIALSLIEDDAMQSDAFAERSFEKREIEKALIAIDGRYRELLILRFFENKEYQEISDILTMPIGTVSTQLYRAKAALRKKLSHMQDSL